MPGDCPLALRTPQRPVWTPATTGAQHGPPLPGELPESPDRTAGPGREGVLPAGYSGPGAELWPQTP